MIINHSHYIPCVKWKQGEYQAFSRLSGTAKQSLTPLIEIPEIEWNYKKNELKKTLDDHLEPFAKYVEQKWGKEQCFIDLINIDPAKRMSDGVHPVSFVFSDLRSRECLCIPVTGLEADDDYNKAIRKVIEKDRRAACLRMTIEQASKIQKTDVDKLLSTLHLQHDNCDLVIDLRSPSFIPINAFSLLIKTIYLKLPHLNKWRSLTILGSSFPKSMGSINKGEHLLNRDEWLLYKDLAKSLQGEGKRIPSFGDYTISHPEPLRLDMRLIKPSANIRYTIDDSWYVIKGSNTRDNGFEQYQGFCKALLEKEYAMEKSFSWGDNYIHECAEGIGSTGNHSIWRCVGTNHHIEKIIRDIANFAESLTHA